jgi:hypothetical protein
VHTPTFTLFPGVRDQVALGYLIPTFGAHRGLSPKTTPVMPPRRQSQCLHPDKALPKPLPKSNQWSTPTQTLSIIVEGSEHPTFGDIPKLQLRQSATMSTTIGGSSQNGGGASSTQTVQPKPTEATHINHPRGHSRQYKSFRATLSLIRSKCKTERGS